MENLKNLSRVTRGDDGGRGREYWARVKRTPCPVDGKTVPIRYRLAHARMHAMGR